MAANKLYGIIYMSPLKLKLNIIDLKTQEIIETASSSVFVQEKHKSSIYRHELKKIVAALDGFLQLLKDYHIADYDFWANQQLVDDVSARYLSDQIYVRTKLRVKWLNTSQITYYKTIATMECSKHWVCHDHPFKIQSSKIPNRMEYRNRLSGIGRYHKRTPKYGRKPR